MAYRDFDLRSARERFALTLDETRHLFTQVPTVCPSAWLTDFLAEWAPIAQAHNTEKARSEMIIAPILMEVVRASHRQLNLFSGPTFSVDRSLGLDGSCNYLLTRSPEQYFVDRPVMAVIEAKREDVVTGLGQCLAALVGVQRFNGDAVTLPYVLGAVTTGSVWRFVMLTGTHASIDRTEYYLPQVDKILGIFLQLATVSVSQPSLQP
jgi:hypothetical protein